MIGTDHPEENKSSFSFEMQLDLKEGYGFEDFPEVEPQRYNKDKSIDNDEPHFNPKELAIQKQHSAIKLNPFATGSDSASKDNTKERMPMEQPSNPFATIDGSSNTSHNNRRTQPAVTKQQSVQEPRVDRRQVTFGPNDNLPSKVEAQPQKVEGKRSPQGDSNFFTFKRAPEAQRMSSNEQLAATIELVKSEIEYYKQEIKRQEYQSMRLAEKELEMTYLNQQADDRLQACSKTVLLINQKVELKSRQQEELTKTYINTLQDRDALIDDIRTGLAAQEQDLPTEEETQLLQELEAIAQQLQNIESKNEELQLSRLVSSLVPGDSGPYNGSALLAQLYNAVQTLGCPKFNKSVKMACLKNRWVLWENSELQIGVVYSKRNNELTVELHIGNKRNKELLQFTLKFADDDKPFFDKETLRERSYMKTEKKTEDIVMGFLRFALSYEIELGTPIVNQLLLPVVFLHFGEFEPINTQLFLKKWKKVQQKCKSSSCPVDKDIVQTLPDFRKYLSNLVEALDKSGNKILGGVFRFSCGAVEKHELAIKIKQTDLLVRFSVGTLPGPEGNTLSKDTLAGITNSLCLIFTV